MLRARALLPELQAPPAGGPLRPGRSLGCSARAGRHCMLLACLPARPPAQHQPLFTASMLEAEHSQAEKHSHSTVSAERPRFVSHGSVLLICKANGSMCDDGSQHTVPCKARPTSYRLLVITSWREKLPWRAGVVCACGPLCWGALLATAGCGGPESPLVCTACALGGCKGARCGAWPRSSCCNSCCCSCCCSCAALAWAPATSLLSARTAGRALRGRLWFGQSDSRLCGSCCSAVLACFPWGCLLPAGLAALLHKRGMAQHESCVPDGSMWLLNAAITSLSKISISFWVPC